VRRRIAGRRVAVRRVGGANRGDIVLVQRPKFVDAGRVVSAHRRASATGLPFLSDEGLAAFQKAYSKAYDPAYIGQQWKDTIPQFGDAGKDVMTLNDADWVALIAAIKDLDIVKEPLKPADYYTNDYLPSG